MENPISEGDAWGEDQEGDYYNDRPGVRPPLAQASDYSVPTSNLPVSIPTLTPHTHLCTPHTSLSIYAVPT